jgi:hypothetical protein
MPDAYEVRSVEERGYWRGTVVVRVADDTEIASDCGEPEDRTFYRDLRPVVSEMNRLAAEVAKLRKVAEAAERLRDNQPGDGAVTIGREDWDALNDALETAPETAR